MSRIWAVCLCLFSFSFCIVCLLTCLFLCVFVCVHGIWKFVFSNFVFPVWKREKVRLPVFFFYKIGTFYTDMIILPRFLAGFRLLRVADILTAVHILRWCFSPNSTKLAKGELTTKSYRHYFLDEMWTLSCTNSSAYTLIQTLTIYWLYGRFVDSCFCLPYSL